MSRWRAIVRHKKCKNDGFREESLQRNDICTLNKGGVKYNFKSNQTAIDRLIISLLASLRHESIRNWFSL